MLMGGMIDFQHVLPNITPPRPRLTKKGEDRFALFGESPGDCASMSFFNSTVIMAD